MRRAHIFVNGQDLGDFPIHDLRLSHDGSERPAEEGDEVRVVICDDTRMVAPLVTGTATLNALGKR